MMNSEKIYQLDFFKDPEISRLEAEIESDRESSHKVRKKLFGSMGKLQKMYDEIKADHEIFKRLLCRGKE